MANGSIEIYSQKEAQQIEKTRKALQVYSGEKCKNVNVISDMPFALESSLSSLDSYKYANPYDINNDKSIVGDINESTSIENTDSIHFKSTTPLEIPLSHLQNMKTFNPEHSLLIEIAEGDEIPEGNQRKLVKCSYYQANAVNEQKSLPDIVSSSRKDSWEKERTSSKGYLDDKNGTDYLKCKSSADNTSTFAQLYRKLQRHSFKNSHSARTKKSPKSNWKRTSSVYLKRKFFSTPPNISSFPYSRNKSLSFSEHSLNDDSSIITEEYLEHVNECYPMDPIVSVSWEAILSKLYVGWWKTLLLFSLFLGKLLKDIYTLRLL